MSDSSPSSSDSESRAAAKPQSSTAAAVAVSDPKAVQAALKSLSSFLSTVPSSISSSPNPAHTLLHDPTVTSQISSLLRHPDSGSGDNNLCRWLYDTFHAPDSQLQLVVLRFIPLIAGLYLSRISQRKSLAGFEAILLALYSHETTARGGQPVTVHVPDLSHPSIYHEAKPSNKTNATELNLAVTSATLEPHGTMRSTRRARIVGVALELYYSKISQLPVSSKVEFCEFCKVWAGEEGGGGGGGDGKGKGKETKETGRIPLPWELMQPSLRILGHCLMGSQRSKDLYNAASAALKCMHARSLRDIDAKAILATTSLLHLEKIALDSKSNHVDYTEIKMSNKISL